MLTAKNKIHFCFITDDAYIIPTMTVIRSLIETKAISTSLVIHILAADLSDESVSLFGQVACEGVEIDARRVALDDLRLLQNTHKMGICMATPAALLKFSIADVFTDVERMIYLDGDLIIRRDLSALYNCDLGDNILAAVRDLGACWWQHAYVKKVEAYINTGVMVMDLVKMRREGIAQRLLDTKRQLVDSMFMDQDVFNVVLDKRIKLLPIEYNVSMPQLIWSYRRGSYDFKMLNDYYGSKYYNFKEIHDAAVVIHYSSKYKPWKYSNAPFGDEWMAVFRRSTVADLQLNLVEGNDFYLGFAWDRWLNRSLPDKEMEVAVDCEYNLVADRARQLEADMNKKIDAAVKTSCEAVQRENRKLSVENGCLRGENNALSATYQLKVGETPQRQPGDRLIASLTSYPARMGTIYKTIESIFCQTMKADEVVLWLCREQFPKNYVFPSTLDYCFAKGLKVEWVDDNVKPHTKYLFALRKYPDANIVTFDDDSIYPSTRIAELYASHLKFPHAVISARVHRLMFDQDGNIMPYATWEKNCTAFVDRPMFSLCALGVAGALYPPHCLPPEVDNVQAIKAMCLCADDIWLKMMEIIHGVPVVRSNSENLSEPIIDGTQETALWKQNCGKFENDLQLMRVVECCRGLRDNFDILGFIYSHRDDGITTVDELPKPIPVRRAFEPQLSVVVPVHNVVKYLGKFVDSVLLGIHMSDLRVEVVFVDDGSTDGSQDLLKEYCCTHDNFGVIFQLNGGAGNARNVGMEAAKGEFICFCDPDDWIDPLMIDKLYRKAQSDGSDVVLCGRTVYDESKKQFTGTNLYEVPLVENFKNGFKPAEVADKICNAFYYVPWGKIIRRRMLMESGIRFPNMLRNEDMSFAISTLVAAERISIVNEPLYVYRRNRVGSLQYGIEKSPYTQIEAARHTLKFLKATGNYELYRNSFQKFVFMESVVRLRELSGMPSAQREFYERLKSEFVQEFGLSELQVNTLRLDMRKPFNALLSHCGYGEFLASIAYKNKTDKLKTVQKPQQQKQCSISGALISWRVDCRYPLKDVASLSPVSKSEAVVVFSPTWLKSAVKSGQCMSGSQHNGLASFTSHGAGRVTIELRGQDVRTTDGKERIPFWVDYTSVKVNGKEMLKGRSSVWHDKPYKFTIDVNAGETVEIAVETVPHVYERAVLRDMLLKAKLPVKVDEGNVEEILDSPELRPFVFDRAEIFRGLRRVFSWRMDCRYALKDVEKLTVVGQEGEMSVSSPEWIRDKDMDGQSVLCSDFRGAVSFKPQGTGEVMLNLLGPVVLDKTGKTRLPVYVTYTSIKVNGRELLPGKVMVWHGKPYKLLVPVKAGATVELSVSTEPYVYTRAAMKDILLRAKLPFTLPADRIDEILDDPWLRIYLVGTQKTKVVEQQVVSSKRSQKEARRVAALERRADENARRAEEMLKRLQEANAKAEADKKKVRELEKQLATAQRRTKTREKEVAELKASEAYRVGMVVTGPARSLKRAFSTRK